MLLKRRSRFNSAYSPVVYLTGCTGEVERVKRTQWRLPVDDRRVTSNAVQPLCGHCLHGFSHGWVAHQNRIEMIHRQREQVAVGLRANTGNSLVAR